jgi:hypothetical protein
MCFLASTPGEKLAENEIGEDSQRLSPRPGPDKIGMSWVGNHLVYCSGIVVVLD